jgi:hypothetical protein
MKKWYLSKTLWINIIAFIAFFIQVQFGKDLIPPEVQASLLAVINLILRMITREELDWGDKQ